MVCSAQDEQEGSGISTNRDNRTDGPTSLHLRPSLSAVKLGDSATSGPHLSTSHRQPPHRSLPPRNLAWRWHVSCQYHHHRRSRDFRGLDSRGEERYTKTPPSPPV